MPKLNKLFYYTSTGEKKLNCYSVTIAKEAVEKAGINESAELKITVENGKIVIEGEAK